MRTTTKGAIGALAIALSACSGPPQPASYKPCPSANGEVLFTVTLPVLRSEAEVRICTPGAGQRMDVLVPPAQPGSTAATPTEQINLMGGVQIPNLLGDPAGYVRGRGVVVAYIPLVEHL